MPPRLTKILKYVNSAYTFYLVVGLLVFLAITGLVVSYNIKERVADAPEKVSN